uniref:Amino acid adenylation domain-containing protein/thioester reductase domain-containing protein n=1 Tax=Candidatus Kentrum sp. LPFa TaxID=2126335 RepID=A0A450X4M6_9GAMM|nr:MAG: amino acid adenylation domain-containing protein/thioester reductase domain-containing protein [Candidatus Kentron sp. LPFa]VFK24237.1 MAG: amino acid adenylation domain-containing protein/thioester reductase domain-containing protein [Candidatus Kentron sp. LPFa]
MNDLPEMKENLSPEKKRELLRKLLRDKASQLKTSHPLSYVQKALWFLYRSAPESAAYNVAAVARVHSPLDVSVLRDVFQILLTRHPSLRTTFSLQDDQPIQILHGTRTVDFEEIDASEDTDEALGKRVLATYRRPFDLEKDTLLRVSLFTRAAEDHVLLLTSHHIVCDGWSTWVLISEFLSLYPARKADQAAALPPLKWQYQDFIHWQAELLESPKGEQMWEYWREHLKSELPVLDLPTDRPRPPVQTYNGATITFLVPTALTARINDRMQASGATLYMIVMAAFQVLLHRYTGQNDIIVGSPTAGRSRSEFEAIVGYFVNSLALRANLEGDPSFSAFLGQVRETMLGGLAHQDYPFPLLVERLQPRRDLSRTPIFQALFVLQKIHSDDELSIFLFDASDKDTRIERGGLSLSPFKMPQQEGQVDLMLEMVTLENSLSGAFSYNADLFDADTIIRMVGHFQSLLEGIVADPSLPVSRLPLLTEPERRQILIEWNETKTPYPANKCVHDLFEEQVAKNPGAVAVIFEGEEISYGELNVRANQLAHRLRALGIGPETLVGLFMERSVEMIVGILAILKADGAYAPLDLKYPPERLAFMVEDADLKVLLCHGATREKLPECAARILDVNAEASEIAGEDSTNPDHVAKSDNLAYVIYTSGSTGIPKGVCVEHGNIVRLVQNTDYVDFDETQVFLQAAQIAFDASTFEIWGSLLNGAKLVVPAPGGLSLEEIGGYLQKHKVTAIFLTTALFNLMVQERPGDIADLEFLLCGGEVGSPENMRKAARLLAPGKLIHCYGPTENTTFSTCYTVPTDVDAGRPIPIGGPISNTRIYILDDRMQPVPVGIGGELYTGGVGVARGYLNRPDLNAERFIPDPFSNELGARLYRTGDSCRWLPDGTIEFLGRIDTQVKIRGFRIECGEVENALLLHPDIRETVVAPHGEGQDKRLVAWLVAAAADQSALRDALRTHLRESLPDWMMPSIFVFVDSFPLTPNGKIDRRALPDPDMAGDVGSTAEYTVPQTESEIEMAALWSKALGVEKVGLHDSFFDLGGHSLLAIELISQVKEHFGVDVPMRVLFEGPTVSGVLKGMGLARTETEKKGLDLDREARLEDDIRPQSETLPASQVENPQHVLVTGATGFLGIYLVGELLRRTRAIIWCFVRGEDQQEAEKRFEAALVEHDQAMDGWRQRIKVARGDLKQERLGLTEKRFQELIDKIDVIYHNGAEVNHVYPYQELRKANVEGTKEILRIACAGRKKPVHYVSTLGVFAGTAQAIREDSELVSEGLADSGYVQSKWVGEKLIWEAGNRGLPVAVYRPDRIGGHSKTGKWNDKDILYQMVIGSIGWGISPDWDYVENVAPVDYCAKALVWLSLREETLGCAYHLANSESVSSRELTNHVRANGFSVRQLPYKEWREAIEHGDKEILEYFLDHVVGDGDSPFKGETQKLECSQTIQALSGSGIQCPPITAELIGRYLKSMQRTHGKWLWRLHKVKMKLKNFFTF